MNIRPTKRQKALVIDSDMGSENETHGAGECFFASAKRWIEGSVPWKLKDFTGVSGLTIESDNLPGVHEIAINFWLAKIPISSQRHTFLQKSPGQWSVTVLLDSVCRCFVEDFRIYAHQWHWPVILFVCCFWCQCNLIEGVRGCPAFAVLWNSFRRIGVNSSLNVW